MEQGSHQLQVGAKSQEEIQQPCPAQLQPLASGSSSQSTSRPSVIIQVDPDDPLGLNRIRNSLLSQPRNPNGGGSSRNGNGDSPESTSLYSDEIPSGYNSGEQYDTLSTGYMSGEAYELPETRMELREPALDPIEEGRGSLGGTGGAASNSDDNMFVHIATEVGATSGGLNLAKAETDKTSVNSLSTTSSSDDGAVPTVGGMMMMDSVGMAGASGIGRSGVIGGVSAIDANILHHSPMGYTGVKSKLRKKVTTFANQPMDLASGDYLEAYESSDAGMGGSSAAGGYRAVPSDTDTSAIDSDANAVLTDGGGDEEAASATALLRAAHSRSKSGARRVKKNMNNHDENWFNARDNKYWSTSRVICFWLTMLSMIASIVTAGILIATMPTNCDPNRKWFQGSVIMDFRVTSAADLLSMQSNLPHYASLGVRALHLRDVSRKTGSSDSDDVTKMYHPTSMMIDLAQKLLANGTGYNESSTETPLRLFTRSLRENNMSLIVQVPIVGSGSDSSFGTLSIQLQHSVEDTVKFWSEQGVDGVFLDGLEHYGADSWVGKIVERWHDILERYSRGHPMPESHTHEKVLMTSYAFAHRLSESGNAEGRSALKFIDLLDATLDMSAITTNISDTSDLIENMAKWDAAEERPWINWNLRFVRDMPLNNAGAAFQMLLPGTISIGNLNESSLDVEQVRNLTSLRTVAVPIYMNGNYKRCDCEEETTKETNYIVHHPIKDVLQLERFYSRRNRYVLVANFGHSVESLSEIGRIYTGGELVLDTSGLVSQLNSQVLFKQLQLPPGQAIVIKIPK